jgi:cathepsin F
MFLVFALLLCALTLGLTIPEDVQAQFAEWKRLHGRIYQSEDEEITRSQYFFFNWLEARALTASETHGAKFAPGIFGDWSKAEFQRLLGFGANSVNTTLWTKLTRPPVRAAPDSVDWRTKGVVSAVKNQGGCGSCWAFSTTSNVESTIAIATGKLTSLSEQFLVDCDHFCGEYRDMDCNLGNSARPQKYCCDNGCNGGLPPNAWQYIINTSGQPTSEDYPYKGRAGECKTNITHTGKIKNWTLLEEDETVIADHVANVGPVSIAVYASGWGSYHGGIMSSESICPKGIKANHAVNIVGYGSENGTPYWIVRNSWGASWGESGYCRLIRGKNFCGLAHFACTSIA